MIRILTDTSTLYTVEEGKKKGLEVIPLIVTINENTYREYEEINSKEYIELINQGHVPTSSQPAIGEMVEMLEKFIDDEVIIISVADGLSGTYSSWQTAMEMSNHPKVEIVNCKTLAFAQKEIADEAVRLRDAGVTFNVILDAIKKRSEFSKSYLLPTDFEFLKRGGRLTPVAASMSGLLKLQPVVSLTDDGLRLEKFTVGRNFKIALKKVFEDLRALDVNDQDYKFAVIHSQWPEMAEEVGDVLKKDFNITSLEYFELSCAFITHGGPKCLAIQVIKK